MANKKDKKEEFNELMNSIDIIFDINNKYVLLGKRNHEPYKNYWALPGGKQEPFETLQNAVVRTIKQRLNLDVSGEFSKIPNTVNFPDLGIIADLHQIRTYASGTDPRGGNTTVFAIQLHVNQIKFLKLLKPGISFSDLKLVRKTELGKLAFDHAKFIDEYYKYLKPYKETAETYDASKYERPSVTTDILIFTIQGTQLKILLVKRKSWPFKDQWAIPGGFAGIDESLEYSAKRELMEETGVKNVYLEQLFTFGEPKRDPRTRVITVAYYALLTSKDLKLHASTDATDVNWFSVDKLPKLAFDHNQIINYALERIRNKIEYTNIAFQLLPEKFTLTELQKVYETILGKEIDKRNFRKKVKEIDILQPHKEKKMDGAHRPAQLFSFKGVGDGTILKADKRI
ncbi:MAG: NUDIX domain-containing protein [Nanoarchaeota archaeon]|nr:NUDIX domain-containing protein [Nanoarchaeota archaeon]MBU1321163.1 NUDIX domain-containing protein [Nanoarchaeota archaeon]MBU1596963.1 NUDIX domain-containing protein [Nanoarchaeota archaeon]MBU2441519.1 NUDIX domain-containing protein [Nanoarchaeota archaeon]